ncbi:hypothetical protein DL96DRAFT_1277732 [Flagelloscypha sp. PMI_526]|nr:hypothetical protein DL96DRAFT_1277732 [Flagelloscypha sp. PMI_526]
MTNASPRLVRACRYIQYVVLESYCADLLDYHGYLWPFIGKLHNLRQLCIMSDNHNASSFNSSLELWKNDHSFPYLQQVCVAFDSRVLERLPLTHITHLELHPSSMRRDPWLYQCLRRPDGQDDWPEDSTLYSLFSSLPSLTHIAFAWWIDYTQLALEQRFSTLRAMLSTSIRVCIVGCVYMYNDAFMGSVYKGEWDERFVLWIQSFRFAPEAIRHEPSNHGILYLWRRPMDGPWTGTVWELAESIQRRRNQRLNRLPVEPFASFCDSMNREEGRKPLSPPLPDVPWDILALIFQEAARVHRPTALNLTLVSTGVQHAIDQILFKHITIVVNQNHRTTPFLKKMFLSRQNVSPRLLLARTLIYSLHSDGIVSWKLIAAMMSECSNLRSLTMQFGNVRSFMKSSPTLRRLTLTPSGGKDSFLRLSWTLSQPPFQTLTHFGFSQPLETLKEMKDVWPKALFKLTHLRMFTYASEVTTNIVDALSGFIRSFPARLEIVILHLLLTPAALQDISASTQYKEIEQGELDRRLVLAGRESFTWEDAETSVSGRKIER